MCKTFVGIKEEGNAEGRAEVNAKRGRIKVGRGGRHGVRFATRCERNSELVPIFRECVFKQASLGWYRDSI